MEMQALLHCEILYLFLNFLLSSVLNQPHTSVIMILCVRISDRTNSIISFLFKKNFLMTFFSRFTLDHSAHGNCMELHILELERKEIDI